MGSLSAQSGGGGAGPLRATVRVGHDGVSSFPPSTKAPYNVILSDPDELFNTETYTYTCASDGLYIISGTVKVSGSLTLVALVKNGSSYHTFLWIGTNISMYALGYSLDVDLVEGDTIQLTANRMAMGKFNTESYLSIRQLA